MKRIVNDGIGLAYEAIGSGDPAILIHGFGLDRRSMQPLAAALTADYSAYLLDLRGHGESDKPTSDENYALEFLHSDLAALIDEIGGEPVHLIGHSFGAQVALAESLCRPECVKSLTMICSAAYRPAKGEEAIAQWHKAAEYFSSAQQRKVIAALAVSTILGVKGFRDLSLSELYSGAEGPALAAMIRGAFLKVPDNLYECRGLQSPTLILVGSEDTPWIDRAKELQQTAPNARLEIIEGAGHLAHLERPEVVHPLIRRFIASV